MTKSNKIVFILIIIIATFFAASSGLFYSKNLDLQKQINNKDADKIDTATDTKNTKTTTTTPTSTTGVTTPAPLNNRPSSPTDTVTVAQGETLFTVGQTVGLSWTVLAEVNGIDPNKIQAGQVIIVPKNNQVSYTVNTDKVTSLQKQVDGGDLDFRLSALETAKSDSPTVYGLLSTDAYTQSTIDENGGTAVIIGSHNNKNYVINLSQPSVKGAKGIWAITSIKAQS